MVKFKPLDPQVFKQTAQELYAKDHEKRSIPSPKTTRSYEKSAHLWERLGLFLGGPYVNSIDFDTDEVVPTIVLRVEKKGGKYFVEFVDVIFETEGISMTTANKEYGKNQRSIGMIGYDTEFLSDSKTMLSHQFCIDFAPSKRFGFILDTSIRFTDSSLKKFLAAIVLNLKGCALNDWYLFAHFSLAEASWVDSSKKKLIQRKKKEWTGTITLATRPVAKVKKIRGAPVAKVPKSKAPKPEKIKITFADTMNLDPRSLKAVAEDCGLEKYAILPLKYKDQYWFKKCCDRVYAKLDKFRGRRSAEFYRYGARDAIITAGIPIVLHSKFGVDVDFQVRTAKYSEKHMFEWFKENYKGVHEGWQRILGQHKLVIPAKKKGGEDYVKWEPDKLQRHILQEWYKGGRNEARQIGCFEHPVSYFDMTSAYPTSLAALISDFDFGKPIIRARSDGAVQRIQQLMDKGPFQPHGIKMYIRFKPNCKVPMAPVSSESGIIYPLETEGQMVCWPEYWTAKKLDIIEFEFVLAFYEFEALKTRLLPDYILSMIERRKENKVFFKSILNYLSGKLAQGRRPKMPFSTISCPALAAYLTSVTRAAAAEIGNLNEYYAITTDGIISPAETLVPGEINTMLAERLKPTGFEWMKNEFTGDKAVIWKTRGYILFKSTADPKTTPAKERFKQAKMGLQGEEPADFVRQIKDGTGVRKSATTFAKLEDGEIFSFLEKEFKVNPNFDFKYSIIAQTVEERSVEIDGVELSMPCFNTRPLRNMNEHYALRRISDWKMLKKVMQQTNKEFSVKDLQELIQTALLNDRRCRHMVWEFRKRMVRIISSKETIRVIDSKETPMLHANVHRTWKAKPLYPIPSEYGEIEDFRPVLEKEVEVITDEVRRGEVLDSVIKQMEKARSSTLVMDEFVEDEEEAAEEKLLEEVMDDA